MSDEQINIINERVALEDVKNQMAKYQKVAEAYANATPEQRAKVDPALVQSVIDKYNQLKEKRNGLLAQQETRIQQEMQQQRAAQEAAAKKAAQWRGRTVKKTTNNNAFPVATNKDWTIRWSDGTNRYEDGRIRDYWMSVNPNAWAQKTAWNNGYDSRYDVNSPDYVYNKWSYNWKWQYVVNPEFADTYGKYDAGGRRISDDVLAERQAYQDALDMPWERVTWMTTEDLIEAGTILYPSVKATQFAKYWTIRPTYVSKFWNVTKALPNGTNNYLPQGTNNYLGQGNNYLTQTNNYLPQGTNNYLTYGNNVSKVSGTRWRPSIVNNYARQQIRNYNPVVEEWNKKIASNVYWNLQKWFNTPATSTLMEDVVSDTSYYGNKLNVPSTFSRYPNNYNSLNYNNLSTYYSPRNTYPRYVNPGNIPSQAGLI